MSELFDQLKHVTNQSARKLIDGQIDESAAAAYNTRYALVEPARSKKGVDFAKAYRSYVINYNVGEALVRDWIEEAPTPESRWARFHELISTPMLYILRSLSSQSFCPV